MDLAINNLQRSMCHKTQPTNHPIPFFQALEDFPCELVLLPPLSSYIPVFKKKFFFFGRVQLFVYYFTLFYFHSAETAKST